MKNIELQIHGMHCASCEVLIEEKFGALPGVSRVNVDRASGKATVAGKRTPSLAELRAAIQEYGYDVSPWKEGGQRSANTVADYVEIGGIFLIIVSWYLILKRFDLLPALGVTEGMSYGFVFLIGLAASVSTCMAVTGGLLVAVTAKYRERLGNVSGAHAFRPHLAFNAGRIASYAVLGGAVGALGSVIALSPGASGIVTIAVSIVMLLLGLQILGLFPKLTRFAPRMPKGIAHRLSQLTDTDRPYGPFLLGAGTFFLPCGFTQALQLYVLTTGSFVTGALTMLTFSLGTLPALLALGAVSSFARGSAQRYFLRFAGAVVILLGIVNIQGGMALAGWSPSSLSVLFPTAENGKVAGGTEEALPPIVDGKQVVRMRAAGYEYIPNRFRVRAGVPVEWHIDGGAAAGCGRVIVAPAIGVQKLLQQTGETVITFTPDKPGEFAFNCSMGMMTPNSAFVVVPNGS